jgi:hypothetical protein
MAKPGLAEPQFPTAKSSARRSIPEAATPHEHIVCGCEYARWIRSSKMLSAVSIR